MNKRIEWLQRQITEISGFAEKEIDILDTAPDDKAAAFFADGHRAHLDELHQELRLEQAKRRHEVFELRLIGNQVDNATVPLSLLAKIAAPLSNLLGGASYRLRHLQDAHIIPRDWINMLDLRLAGIAPGSSRLVMTGDVAPDLVGDSPLQDALTALFNVLTTNPDGFVDQLHAIGVKAGKKLAELLEVMEKEDLACELSWTDPADIQHKWRGTRAEMACLRVMLESVDEPEERLAEVTGTITLLAATGRIELETADGKAKVTFNKSRPELVSDYHIGQSVTLQTRCSTYYDPIKDLHITKHTLHSEA